MKNIKSFTMGIVASAIISALIYSCDPLPSDPGKFAFVPISDFVKDVARYHQTHALALNSDLNRFRSNGQPSRTCVYTLDTLQKFMNFIRVHSRAAGMNEKTLGIRFFYGVYPVGQNIAGADYGSLHTLFMVPVYQNEDSTFTEFDPIKTYARSLSGNSSPVTLRELSDSSRLTGVPIPVFILDASSVPFPAGRQIRFAGLGTRSEAAVVNQGQLCPPNCPEDSFLEYVDELYTEGRPYGSNTDDEPIADGTEL